MGLHHAKTLMAPITLSQSAHSVIVHQFTTPSSSRHAAAKMSPLYANVLKKKKSIFLGSSAAENTSITPSTLIVIHFEESC